MTKIESGVACPHCLGKVYQARTAMGIMFRCDDCHTDWFEDTLRKSPRADDAVDPPVGITHDEGKCVLRELYDSEAPSSHLSVFDFNCRACEQITAHRFVLVQPDRILVQCLACAETQCVFELASDQAQPQTEPLNEPEGTAITEQEPERD